MPEIFIAERYRRWRIALSLGALLFLVYLLTFSGTVKSDDELFIIDTTDSMAVRGSLLLNETVYLRGLQTTDVEPAQPVLAVPLYWLAYHIPWAGNVHAIFLFNPIVVSALAVLFFFYALDLGYGERTALIAALLLGLTTILWPYAKTFFREPLTTLNLFAAAFFLERWRRAVTAGGRRHWLWLALGTGMTVLALLSKEAAIIILPALILLAYPGWAVIAKHRRTFVMIAIGLGVLTLVLALALLFYRNQLEALTGRYIFDTRLPDFFKGLSSAWWATSGYLISPAKGIWWFSPILLLALAAPALLPWSRWRESWLVLGLTLWFAVSYAAIRGPLWHGGAGWGARYMLPLTPFLMIAALPLLDWILNHRRWWPKALLGLLVLVGFAVQIGGVYVNIHSYYTYQQHATGLTPWHDSIIWSVRWSQAVGSLLFLPHAETDLIWLVGKPDWVTIGVIVAALLLSAFVLWLAWRRAEPPARKPGRLGWLAATPLLALGMAVFALWQARDDFRYEGHNESLHALLDTLDEKAGPESQIMLSSPSYTAFFMNFYKGRAIWYSLPLSPGQRYSADHAPEVVSDRVEDLVAPGAVDMFESMVPGGVLYTGQPLWLVVDQSPVLAWSNRPPEWYLTRHRFQFYAQDFSPLVRLVGYLPLAAPDADDTPAQPLDVRFGEGIRLLGYDLLTTPDAAPEVYHPNQMIGISLLWEGLEAIDFDYTVGVYLIDEDGQLVLQQDRYPEGGFAPTSAWEPGTRLRDNYGFVLPDTIRPGQYEIWVAIYKWPELTRLSVTDLSGSPVTDHWVLGTIRVGEPPAGG
jgi:hypothetical protein